MTIPDDIAPQEDLGRGVFSSQEKKRAERSQVSLQVFLEKEGEADISVDRLDYPTPQEVAAIGERAAFARGRTFYGWAVVTAEDAGTNQRQVRATPLKDNPYHADIVLPDIAGEDREEQKRHAQELRDVSRWRSRS